jgi:regulator of replication initiation timing
MNMTMKKVAKTATYKFNIRKTVSFSTTMRFSIDATKRAIEHAFANAGLDPLTVAQNTIKELNIRLIESESENSLLKIQVESLLKENTEYKKRNQDERKKIAEEVVKYWRDEIKSEKEKSKKKGRVEVFITTDGLIYREPKEKHNHRIEIKNGRGKLILAMLGKKSYTPTTELIELSGLSTRKSVEGAVYKIRKEIEKKLGVIDFIDGYQDYGYRINPSIIFKKD